jgi:hypothetical protein
MAHSQISLGHEPMKRRAPVFALFFLAPLVAEFFGGDFPIYLLPLIVVLAPMYGGGALLIREVVRRTGRGWPTIVTLALAFGVLEEALLTESLFNPNYLGQRLLDPGFIPALGIGLPWTVFVLTLHVVWSISTPIAIVEESTRDRRLEPWLGPVGLTVTSLLFVLGSVVTFVFSYGPSKHFLASTTQLGVSAAIIVGLVVVAFLLPRPTPAAQRRAGDVPSPWAVFGLAVVAGVTFMAGTFLPVAVGVPSALVTLVVMAVLVLRWSARAAWGVWHRSALGGGALVTYAWHAFTLGAGPGKPGWVLNAISHAIFAAAAVGVAWLAVRRIRRVDTVTPAAVEPVGQPSVTPAG